MDTSASQYPSAKQVTDFHRNSDADRTLEAIHHSIGRGRTQASPGDHVHDGGTSQPLWTGTAIDNSQFSQNLATESGLRGAVKGLIQALSGKGAVDNTSDTTKAWLVDRFPVYTTTADRDTDFALNPFMICAVGTTIENTVIYKRRAGVWRVLSDDADQQGDTGWLTCATKAGFAALTGSEIPQASYFNGAVYLRGGWSNTGIGVNGSYTVASLPAAIPNPSGNGASFAIGSASGASMALCIITAGGDIIIRTPATASSYYKWSGGYRP